MVKSEVLGLGLGSQKRSAVLFCGLEEDLVVFVCTDITVESVKFWV